MGHTEPVKGSYRLALSYTGIHHTTQSSQLGPIIHRAVHQALSILEEVKGVSMAGVGWRLASSMGSACRWAMSSRGERAHTASQRAGERAVRSGACGEDGGAWAAGAPGSRASSATSRASAPRRRPACSSSWRALGRHGHGALGLEHRHISSSYVALVCVKKHNARGESTERRLLQLLC